MKRFSVVFIFLVCFNFSLMCDDIILNNLSASNDKVYENNDSCRICDSLIESRILYDGEGAGLEKSNFSKLCTVHKSLLGNRTYIELMNNLKKETSILKKYFKFPRNVACYLGQNLSSVLWLFKNGCYFCYILSFFGTGLALVFCDSSSFLAGIVVTSLFKLGHSGGKWMRNLHCCKDQRCRRLRNILETIRLKEDLAARNLSINHLIAIGLAEK